jgi:hypothetical protein
MGNLDSASPFVKNFAGLLYFFMKERAACCGRSIRVGMAKFFSQQITTFRSSVDFRNCSRRSELNTVWQMVLPMTSPVRVSGAEYSEKRAMANIQSYAVQLCQRRGQIRIKAVECLDCAFFIDTDDRSVYQRLNV